MLLSCDLWSNYDGKAGWRKFKDGAAINVKVRKNDQFRQGHQALPPASGGRALRPASGPRQAAFVRSWETDRAKDVPQSRGTSVAVPILPAVVSTDLWSVTHL